MTLARFGTGENLMMSKEADTYWLAILGGTFAYDAWAMNTNHETASSGMRRYIEAPWQKVLFCGVLGGLALHFLSYRYDPGRLLFERELNTTPTQQ